MGVGWPYGIPRWLSMYRFCDRAVLRGENFQAGQLRRVQTGAARATVSVDQTTATVKQ
ncbi:hypothetical protein GA0070604_1665 [Micromonospora eburnea]|uniref:Uncharacterized protein n=1 Tax=Micromonospora eburnea TaxID=227316 RepID=A0A1C6U2J9_9ACTN|nr:hypothetical protein GA0070604_1665 [Micromonospora eburnea]